MISGEPTEMKKPRERGFLATANRELDQAITNNERIFFIALAST